MRFRMLRCLPPLPPVVFIGVALLLLMGGCPIDSDQLATDVVRAALESITDSAVEALSTFLAGN